jgi:NAD(P)-dependent dehydrogenase (short-subunit alcohol dehydrogenase family)
VDLSVERSEVTRAALSGSGHLALAANVASDEAMETLRDTVLAEWGGLDVLVNNAGIASAGLMVNTTMPEWRQVIETNLLSVVRGCRMFLPAMLEAGRGQVVNTASFAAIAGAPGAMSYGVAKAGVLALSEQLRAEVGPSGIGVSVICPSFFRTNLCDHVVGNQAAKSVVIKLMDHSPDTLDSVADKTFEQAEAGRFLILPTKREPMLWRLKRFLPEFYYRQMLKRTSAMRGASAPVHATAASP